jgi:hypothetical protein
MASVPDTQRAADVLDRRLHDIGWGLLFILTGLILMTPADRIASGTWPFGVAAILIGLNIVRYVAHVAVNGFTLVLGLFALAAGVSQRWGVDVPLLALCSVIVGLSLVARTLRRRRDAPTASHP